MPSETHFFARRSLRFLSTHNPLYLVSAWLVLYGLSRAFQGDVGLRWVPLMTQLVCGYTLALALSGWVVVRAGEVWNDARMILLVVLLMFAAISTSYDNLCLKDPLAGAQHLAVGFAFSCAITELILFSLGMKLPFRYRAPFYLQLAVLFAFPAWLGKLSVDGRDPEMCLGVLLFPMAAAVALLTLLPAAAEAPQRDNGTPWPWPFYPWSLFVFVAIACGIRAWMLSLSFSPAAGVDPAFLPYFLCPILLAMLLLVLEIALRQKSVLAQQVALVAMLGAVWMAFPGERLNSAQRLLVELLESSLAGPPLLICAAVGLIALYGMLRRAAGSEFVALASLTLLAFLEHNTRSTRTMGAPNELLLLALTAWLLGYGAWSRTTLRLAFGGIAMLILWGRQFEVRWMFQNNAYWAFHLSVLWCAVLPLYCRDELANWLRSRGPLWIMTLATAAALVGPGVWLSVPTWAPAIVVTALSLLSLVYLATFRVRWYVLAATWAAAWAIVVWSCAALGMLQDLQLRRGLAWYVAGCQVLVAALLVSLWKAGMIRRAWAWMQNVGAQPQDVESPGG